MRAVRLTLSCVIALGSASCEHTPQPAPRAAAESAGAQPIREPGEISPPPVPTHWIARPPVAADAGPVTDQMLLDPYADRSRWLHYGGDYSGWRHSPLTSLNPRSVSRLRLAWALPTGTTGQFEVSPVVYAGVMYVTTSYNRLFALDARTGDVLWRYDHEQPPELKACCGPVNRGVAIAGERVLMATLDARLLAFDRRTGELLWDTKMIDHMQGYAPTAAPLVAGDLAIIGTGGGDYGARGFFDAYDLATGRLVWRHQTVPMAGEPGAETWEGDSAQNGGAPTWTTGAYDPATDTLFWTTGNPAPGFNGEPRGGDNLYSDSLLAVDRKTGQRRWHFQFTPHDLWDYDGNTQLFLVDVERGGRKIPAIAQANRNGFFYLIDRRDGSFLHASPYVEVTWGRIGPDGRPIVNPAAIPSDAGSARVCPSNMGGMNGAWTGSYDPKLRSVFIPAIESCQTFQTGITVYVPGHFYIGGLPSGVDAKAGKAWGHVSAIDVQTGEIRWQYRDPHPMMAGVLSTAGGVLFTGTVRGDALALDSKSGELLWSQRIGGSIRSQPVAYELDGRPYVAIGSGGSVQIDGFVTGLDRVPEGGHLFVFTLADASGGDGTRRAR
jgi:alcohol dehydrogenase (cytochrome c)